VIQQVICAMGYMHLSVEAEKKETEKSMNHSETGV
jgi:hypothetical protein